MKAMNPTLRRLALVCLWLLAGAVCAADVARGFVFEISRDGQPRGYLVGTMHSEDQRVTGLMDRVAPLISRVDAVAIELVPDAVTMMAVGAATLLPGDQRLQQLVGDERFAALRVAAQERGLSIDLLDRLKPWAVAVTLAMPAQEPGQILDMQIYLESLRQGREVLGLETAAEQIGVFSQMSRELQLALFDGAVKMAPQAPKLLEELTRVYVQGDTERLAQVARAQYSDMMPSVAAWLDEVLIVARNRRMLERLDARLEQQRLLAAVGAMHLVGETGLIEGLRRLGYQVARSGE